MPVARVASGERLLEAIRCQPLFHHFIRRHIIRIIVVDEFVPQHGPIGEHCGNDDCCDTDREVALWIAV